ncbi:MAG: c-type cytochrome [Spirochaetes bacterium]|nr:c-type cytochrome [Spirochaetota bacterium]
MLYIICATVFIVCSSWADDMLLPTALAGNGDIVYIANENGKSVFVYDLGTRIVSARVSLPSAPTGLALSGQTLYVTGGLPSGVLYTIDTASMKITATTALPSGACAPRVVGTTLVVCNRYAGSLSFIDIATGKERKRISVGREPVATAVSGGVLYVAQHLPDMPANAASVHSVITTVDIERGVVTGTIALPNGSTALRDITAAPDGSIIAVHNVARFDLPTTQIERGWMNTAALTVLKPGAANTYATVMLDDPESGAANPYAVALSPSGKTIFVAHAGTHEVSIIDRGRMTAKLEAMNRTALSYDLTFMRGIRQRIALGVNGPRSILVTKRGVITAGYFSDALALIGNINSTPSVNILPLRDTVTLTDSRRGEMYFNDAKLCLQNWQSCSSCHPDGRVDALNWDLMNDGMGNPKNARSLLNSFRRSPVMSHGIRASADVAVRSGIRFILFTVQPEPVAEAMDAYLKAMESDPSPYLVNGKLSAKALRGKTLFESPGVGCTACHTGPLFTDLKLHDVGTMGPYDSEGTFVTPTFIELWRTAPYFHDGRYSTVKEVITVGNKEGKRGKTAQLTPAEIDDLVEYLLSL